jgi:hypothetical protein
LEIDLQRAIERKLKGAIFSLTHRRSTSAPPEPPPTLRLSRALEDFTKLVVDLDNGNPGSYLGSAVTPYITARHAASMENLQVERRFPQNFAMHINGVVPTFVPSITPRVSSDVMRGRMTHRAPLPPRQPAEISIVN